VKNVILTGSSGGIGSAVARRLIENGYRILTVESRLEDIPSLEKEIKSILSEYSIDVLINCAGYGIFQPHEEISPMDMKSLIDINLTAPLVLSGLCLRSLKATGGHIINISSIEATRHSKYSALYTASKSGLRDFSLSLFEEVRKSGVRVSSINPDITKTQFFDKLGFGPGEDSSSYLDPEDIATAALMVLQSEGVVADLTIRPQRAGVTKKPRT